MLLNHLKLRQIFLFPFDFPYKISGYSIFLFSFFSIFQARFTNKMKAVITGASGLLGRPTVNEFKNAAYEGNDPVLCITMS